jgi:hypothetical protein
MLTRSVTSPVKRALIRITAIAFQI